MENQSKPGALPHSLTLQERKKLSVTGVKRIIYYDESGAQLDTDQGRLTVGGQQLQVSELSVQTGQLEISGLVESLQYTAAPGPRTGLFGRLGR